MSGARKRRVVMLASGELFYVMGPDENAPGYVRLRHVNYGPRDDRRHGVSVPEESILWAGPRLGYSPEEEKR